MGHENGVQRRKRGPEGLESFHEVADWLSQMRQQYGSEYQTVQPRSHALARKRKPPTCDGALYLNGTFKLTPAEKARAKMSKYEIEEVALRITKRESGNCELPRTRAAARAQTEEWNVTVELEPFPILTPIPTPRPTKRAKPAALTPALRAARKKQHARLATHAFECEHGCGYDAATEHEVITHEATCARARPAPPSPAPPSTATTNNQDPQLSSQQTDIYDDGG